MACINRHIKSYFYHTIVAYFMIGPSIALEGSQPITARQIVDDYQFNSSKSYSLFVAGLFTGIMEVEVRHHVKNTPLICPPMDVPISRLKFISVIDDFLSKHQSFNNEPAAVVAVYAMISEFPCLPKK